MTAANSVELEPDSLTLRRENKGQRMTSRAVINRRELGTVKNPLQWGPVDLGSDL